MLMKFGIVGMAQSTLTRWACGYFFIHPGYFVSALLGSAVINIGAEKIEKESILQ
jgi:hypothetical protein